MKNKSTILTIIKTRNIYLIITLVLFLSLFIFGQVALAQKDLDVIAQPFKINGKEVKEYLMEKYKLRKDEVTSDIQQTPNGPKGKVLFRGEIIPKSGITGKDKLERSRAIAKAFLEEESSLLGITNLDEIREIGIHSDKGHDGEYTMINYRRVIDNLEMGEMYIRVEVNPGERITWVDAQLVPAPPQLYEAVKRKTLSETEIRQIVEDDQKSAGIDPQNMRILYIGELAITAEPYVIWAIKVHMGNRGGTWSYTINAFTGKILKKVEVRIFTR